MRPLTAFLMPRASLQQLGLQDSKVHSQTARQNLQQSFEKIRKQGGDPDQEHYIINLGGSSAHYMQNCCPCLTRSRSQSKEGFYASWLGRPLGVPEIIRLQGAPAQRFHDVGISPRQLGAIAGNAIPVDLLSRVMLMLFHSAGLVRS